MQVKGAGLGARPEVTDSCPLRSKKSQGPLRAPAWRKPAPGGCAPEAKSLATGEKPLGWEEPRGLSLRCRREGWKLSGGRGVFPADVPSSAGVLS